MEPWKPGGSCRDSYVLLYPLCIHRRILINPCQLLLISSCGWVGSIWSTISQISRPKLRARLLFVCGLETCSLLIDSVSAIQLVQYTYVFLNQWFGSNSMEEWGRHEDAINSYISYVLCTLPRRNYPTCNLRFQRSRWFGIWANTESVILVEPKRFLLPLKIVWIS